MHQIEDRTGGRVLPRSTLRPEFSIGQVPWLLLLIPRVLALRGGVRRLDRSGRVRALVLATLVVLFWGGAFWFFHRVLGYFRTIPDLGPVLSQKLLSVVFLTFFALLLFSNVIAGLSTFFLWRDLLLLILAPLLPALLCRAGSLDCLAGASCMLLFV